MSAAVTAPASDRAVTYQWVLDALADEQDRLYALASTLAKRLEPANPQQPEDDAPVVEWRLAQMLEERLEKTSVHNAIREVLMGVLAAEGAAAGRAD